MVDHDALTLYVACIDKPFTQELVLSKIVKWTYTNLHQNLLHKSLYPKT